MGVEVTDVGSSTRMTLFSGSRWTTKSAFSAGSVKRRKNGLVSPLLTTSPRRARVATSIAAIFGAGVCSLTYARVRSAVSATPTGFPSPETIVLFDPLARSMCHRRPPSKATT